MKKRTFMAQHVLEDFQDQYVEAVYRFRQAELEKSCDYSEARREMNRLEKCVLNARYRIYTNNGESLMKNENVLMNETFLKCPEPDWVNKYQAQLKI